MPWEHQQESEQMGDKFALRFLGLLETTQDTLEQSHGIPPGSGVLDNTTLGGSGSCGYPSLKTVRSIDFWARGYFCRSSGNVTDEVIQAYIEDQDRNSDDVFRIEGESSPTGDTPIGDTPLGDSSAEE